MVAALSMDQGSTLNIMDPLTRHSESFPVGKVFIDWLEAGIFCDEGYQWERMLAKLEEWQALAKAGKCDFKFDNGGDCLLMEPTGARAGTFYGYRFSVCGIRFLVKQNVADRSFPGIRFVASGEALTAYGEQGVWDIVRRVVDSLGVYYHSSALSRVDLAVDLVGVKTGTITKRFQEGQWVSRAERIDLHYAKKGVCTGVTVNGGRPVMLRVYDKLLEVGQDSYKKAALESNRWGVVDPEAVTRVEFQIRSEVLRKKGIRGYEDLHERLAGLGLYCAAEWCRVVVDIPDRANRNQGRAEVAEEWQRVIDAMQAAGDVVELVPVATLEAHVSRSLSVGLSCLAKAAVLLGDAENKDQFLGFLEQWCFANAPLVEEKIAAIRCRVDAGEARPPSTVEEVPF